MPDFRVEWSIDIEGAKDPEEAARRAWRHMRARGSIANCFDVYLVDGDGVPTKVDLLEIDEERAALRAQYDDAIATGTPIPQSEQVPGVLYAIAPGTNGSGVPIGVAVEVKGPDPDWKDPQTERPLRP